MTLNLITNIKGEKLNYVALLEKTSDLCCAPYQKASDPIVNLELLLCQTSSIALALFVQIKNMFYTEESKEKIFFQKK